MGPGSGHEIQRPSRWRRRAKFAAVAVVYVGLFMLFQNFSNVPISNLRPDFNRAYARSFVPTEGSTHDMRDLAPDRPTGMENLNRGVAIASPRSGTDLGSIGQDWAMRQTRLITGGAEERFLLDLNKRMNRMIRFDDGDDEDSAEATADGSGAAATSKSRAIASRHESRSDYFGLRPRSMRFTSLNRFEVGLGTNTSLSCSFMGDSLRWDLSRPINERFDVSLSHESARSKSSLLLNYSW